MMATFGELLVCPYCFVRTLGAVCCAWKDGWWALASRKRRLLSLQSVIHAAVTLPWPLSLRWLLHWVILQYCASKWVVQVVCLCARVPVRLCACAFAVLRSKSEMCARAWNTAGLDMRQRHRVPLAKGTTNPPCARGWIY